MRHTRSGFTLMEIMLVLVVLVIISALAIPTISSMFRGNNLDAAKDTVTGELTKARNKAQEERRAYKFAIKLTTGNYRIAPDSDEFWGGNGGSGSSSDSGSGMLESYVTEGSLPEGICFCQSDGVSNNSGGGDWTVVATFLADGTAMDDVQVGIGFDGGQPVLIRLKATTGTISTASLPATSNAQ